MPKIIIHSAEGTFDAVARQAIVAELTDFALDCEVLPKSPFMRSTVWTWFVTCPPHAVFMGDRSAYASIVSAQIFTIEGGLDDHGKSRLIAGTTDILQGQLGAAGQPPVYIVVHEVAQANWGIFGKTADLAAMRASDPNAPAL